MNKKGIFGVARKMVYWMIAAVIITFVVFAFAVVVANYKSALGRVPIEMSAEFISLRFVNNPECFAFYDTEAERVFPGIIDIDKFTQEQLTKCYHSQKRQGVDTFSFYLKLETLGNELRTSNYIHQYKDAIYKEVLVKKGTELIRDQLIILVQKDR